MLILPIVNRGRVLNVEVKLKGANKVRTGIRFSDSDESEVIVNGNSFSSSTYKDDKNSDAILNFIRNNSIRIRRNYLITTREESSSSSYDVYEVEQPPRKINDGLDSLYISLITDLRKEIPGHDRGRYLSLKKLGVGQHLSDEKIQRLESIVKNVSDTREWPALFRREGVTDLVETLEFLKCLDCTVVADSSVKEDSLSDMVDALKKVNTRESRNLSSYYNMALDNRDIYSKLSYINKLVYDKPLDLIQSKKQKQKQLVKTGSVQGDSNVGKAA